MRQGDHNISEHTERRIRIALEAALQMAAPQPNRYTGDLPRIDLTTCTGRPAGFGHAQGVLDSLQDQEQAARPGNPRPRRTPS